MLPQKYFNMHISEQKSELRTQVLKRIKSLSTDERAAESRSICKQILLAHPQPTSVCGYFPLATEVDVRPVLQTYLEQSIPVFLPLFTKNNFTFAKITSLQNLPTGSLAIPEPDNDSEEYTLDATGIVLIPGRAFTESGYRIGRGNGGYDKWIANLPKQRPQLLGVSFELQLLREVPLEPHDQKLDHIITARTK